MSLELRAFGRYDLRRQSQAAVLLGQKLLRRLFRSRHARRPHERLKKTGELLAESLDGILDFIIYGIR
jgi:hypothetical protein